MKTVYAIINAEGEYFSHFTQWQGLHANWRKGVIKTYPTEQAAAKVVHQIETQCLKQAIVIDVVLVAREVDL